jgi:drug/metabolite transporter (DMT)-like permease
LLIPLLSFSQNFFVKMSLAVSNCVGVFNTVAVGFCFYAMARILNANFTAMKYKSLIYIIIGAVLFSKERLATPWLVAIALALFGALFLRRRFRDLGAGHIAMLFALCFLSAFLGLSDDPCF